MNLPPSRRYLWLLGVLCLATAAFATVHPASRVALVGLAGGASTWLLSTRRQQAPLTLGLWAVGLVALALTAATLVPVGPGLRAVLQPAIAPAMDQSLAVVGASARPLAVHPHAALLAWAQGAVVLLFFAASTRTLSHHVARVRATRGLAWLGAAVALVGAAHALTGATSIYWITGVGMAAREPFFAPFVNPNHAAAMLAALLPMAVGYTVYRQSWRTLVAAALMVAGLVLTGSWGGLLAGVVGLLVLVLASIPGRVAAGIATLSAAATAAVYGLGPWRVSTWLELSDSRYDLSHGRLSIWGDSLSLLGGVPWLGVGPGGFADAYGVVRTSTRFSSVAHAHQDYLECAVEGGVLVALAVFAIAAFALVRGVRGVGRREVGRRRVLRAAWLASGCALATSSMVDFPVHIGALALLAALVAGGCAVSGRRIGGESAWFARSAQAVFALALLACVLYVGGRGLTALGDASAQVERGVALVDSDPAEAEAQLARAVVQRPLHHHALLALGALRARTGDDRGALHALEAATAVRPSVPWTWRALARERRRQGDDSGSLAAWRGMLGLYLSSKEEVLPYLEEAMATGDDPFAALLAALPDRGDRTCQAARLLAQDGLVDESELLLGWSLDTWPCARTELAAMHLRAGRYEEVLDLVGPQAEGCDDLRLGARALHKLGRYSEAAASWRLALSVCVAGHERIHEHLEAACDEIGDPKCVTGGPPE